MPNVTTALGLARTLDRRVEDLFGSEPSATIIDGELLGQPRELRPTTRAKAPNGVLGSPGFGSITIAGDPRVIQLGVNVIF